MPETAVLMCRNARGRGNNCLMDLRLRGRLALRSGRAESAPNPARADTSHPARASALSCRQAASLGMTAEPDNDPSREPMTAHEPARRSGSIVLVLLVAGAIVAAAVALATIGRAEAQPYILGLLALLAMVGLFDLFAFAAGIVRFHRSLDRRSGGAPHRRSRL